MAGCVVKERYGVEQFNGKDYDQWKFRMEIILEQQEVKSCITSVFRTENDAAKKLDAKCKSIIIQCIANSHLEYVKEKKTSFEMWSALETVFQRKGIASQLLLRKKLLTMKLKESDSLDEHFMKFESITRELKSVGGKLEEVNVVCQLLLTLPSSYDPIVTALETLEPQKLTLEFVKSKLLDQEMQRNNIQSEETTTAVFSSRFANKGKGSNFSKKINQRKLFKCYNCGKPGHKKADCRFKKQVNHAGNEESHIAFTTGVPSTEKTLSDNSIKWYIDSGATDHMVNSCSYFCEVKDIEPMKISVAKENESLSATKIGTIYVNLSSNDCKSASINEVLYVRNLRHNLLSVNKLQKGGLKVIFENSKVFLKKNSECITVGKLEKNLYEVEFELSKIVKANVCAKTNDFW